MGMIFNRLNTDSMMVMLELCFAWMIENYTCRWPIMAYEPMVDKQLSMV